MTKQLIKSKERVQKHGEVFTPVWMVDLMLNQAGIKEKLSDPFATFLEPAAGDGNFLTAILQKKLTHINQMSKGARYDNLSLWALSSIYGIELLTDNLLDARENMMTVFLEHYQKNHDKVLGKKTNLYKSARLMIEKNIRQGNALTRQNESGQPITFSHWWRVKGTSNDVQRELFTYASLFGAENVPSDEIAGQMDLFDDFDFGVDIDKGVQSTELIAPYKIVSIQQVWKEEKI
ncbi:N-6 DNA methylase [Pseudolactococcus yaeyamensis]